MRLTKTACEVRAQGSCVNLHISVLSSLLTHDGENATGNAAFETDVFSEHYPGSFTPPGENFAFLKSHSSEIQRRLYTCTVLWAVTARGPWHSSVYLAHACSHFACGAILAVQLVYGVYRNCR